jgi:hypothetical protein
MNIPVLAPRTGIFVVESAVKFLAFYATAIQGVLEIESEWTLGGSLVFRSHLINGFVRARLQPCRKSPIMLRALAPEVMELPPANHL